MDAEFCIKPHFQPENTGSCEYGYTHQVDMELTGAVYLCTECITAMGTVIGMLGEKQARELVEENARLVNYVKQLEEQNLGMEKIVDGYRTVAGVNLPIGIGRDLVVTTTNPFQDTPSLFEDSERGDSTGSSLPEGQIESGNSGSSETDEHRNDDGNSAKRTAVSADSNREPGKDFDSVI
jgi:hypothetical protein